MRKWRLAAGEWRVAAAFCALIVMIVALGITGPRFAGPPAVSAAPAQVGFVDPCQSGPSTFAPINIAATAKIISGGAGARTFICKLTLVVAASAANNVGLIEGTGSACATNPVGVAGGATAATGWQFAASGGLVEGTGANAVENTATAGDDVCLILTNATQVSGSVRYIQR